MLVKLFYDNAGKIIVETSIVIPLLILSILGSFAFITHVYTSSINSYLVNRASLYASDTASYNEAFSIIKVQDYVHRYSKYFFTHFKAQLRNENNIQEFTNPTTRLRQIEFIRQLNSKNLLNVDDMAKMKYPFIFKSHTEAAQFLKTYVDGNNSKMKTPYGLRVLDAYQSNGVLQQAFVTYTESQVLKQAKKDAWLLKMNENVVAVIWHFFMRQIKNYKEPSKQLINTLNKMGIIVYVHTP